MLSPTKSLSSWYAAATITGILISRQVYCALLSMGTHFLFAKPELRILRHDIHSAEEFTRGECREQDPNVSGDCIFELMFP